MHYHVWKAWSLHDDSCKCMEPHHGLLGPLIKNKIEMCYRIVTARVAPTHIRVIAHFHLIPAPSACTVLVEHTFRAFGRRRNYRSFRNTTLGH